VGFLYIIIGDLGDILMLHSSDYVHLLLLP
jgi:hypothetical protein